MDHVSYTKKLAKRNQGRVPTNMITRAITNLAYATRAESFQRFGFPHLLPRTALLAITYKCNSKCKTCGIWKIYRDNPQKLKEELTYDEFLIFLNKNSFLKQLDLTGGEPFVRPELHDMFISLDRKGYNTGITTNAITIEHIKEETSRILRDLSGKNRYTLQISIDGIGGTHDYIRGVKGNFEKATALLSYCLEQEKKYPFFYAAGVTLSITGSNYSQLSDYIDYFLKFGLKSQQILFRPVEIAPYYCNEDSDEVEYQNISEVIRTIKKVQGRFDAYKEGLFYKGIIPHLENPSKRLFKCYAGFSFCYIDPYWNVYPCIYWNASIGNLRDYEFDLAKLWSSEDAQNARDVINEGRCSCWTRCVLGPSTISNPALLFALYWSSFRKQIKQRVRIRKKN